ncbi:coniferyl aldehyde dehydrogenase [Colwellia sp. 1_MG-2023]|uniref:coniferyl aldehyde dehydrogenase n=1 Tax=unclassified Colwellia TaxID=196834 RepID=UPI001C08D983|nr:MULTISPECIES: coniferyl aldehyde dehydrogenase [unclassified Colwellia]MBU2923172.1 coniferyl aldehyde dehydrogenase [Colwellia sp. C2M11]MDO6651399.1 coniferyl aldehyde dehydrogenase [Colwellia sp. 3_MG-2023]MDO6664178.1 coniferyl aldehyde dehydrogenase [Colwellia sp. 2_MG-2023]MDO6688708.1 coniferyl aldehyde dehydrogenase [Colwellia sp. 1_MG-2023]
MAKNLYSALDDQQEISQIDNVLLMQKKAFVNDPYLSAQARIDDLVKLKSAILSSQEALLQALSKDFGCRSIDDSKMADLMPTIMGINYAIKHIKKWMKPSKRHVGLLFQPAKAFVMYQPLGVVGIITPWNYPLFLSLGPLTTALAAGNRAMIKMSEFTPATNDVVKEMLLSIFSNDKVAVINGGSDVASHFSEQPFDHLIFTGSTRVGKVVMAAAAKNLTPVTLELGGKSPTIIDDEIEINDAVSRFILAKTLNAGQTCVAPDYLLCPERRVDELKHAISKQFIKMYPSVADNNDYGAIINDMQLQRLNQWLEDARAKGAILTPLGNDNLQDCLSAGKIPLTLVNNVNDEMLLMQEEIFGPILPIVSYKDIDDAIAYVNARPRPLALYLCSHNTDIQQMVLEKTHAGGVCLNDAAMHVAQDDMPFGGIGPSGMGHYHGHEGFLTFSKAKSVFKKGKINTASTAFPPYNKLVHKLIYKLFLK